MKHPYIFGLCLSLLASGLTLLISSVISRYPGFGDFLVFATAGVVFLPFGDFIAVFIPKAVVGFAFFAAVYALLYKKPKHRFAVASVSTVALLVLMSMGQAVIA